MAVGRSGSAGMSGARAMHEALEEALPDEQTLAQVAGVAGGLPQTTAAVAGATTRELPALALAHPPAQQAAGR